MKSLLLGEKIFAVFSGGSKFGTCTIYLTNFGLAVENKKLGIILNLTHDDVLSFLPFGKNSAKISWRENQSFFEFIIQCDKPEEICAKYRQAQQHYAHIRQKIGLGTQTIRHDIAIKNPLVEKRFEKIPEYVVESEIWNDCWFDRTKNVYVTHNKFFKDWEDLQARPHQIEYKIETKDDGIVILAEKTTFKFGLPAIRLPAKMGGVWFLLPTITEQMCTRPMEAARFAKDQEQRIDYDSAAAK